MKFNFENAPLQIIDGDRGENYPKKEEFSNSGYCLFLSTANVTKSGFDFKQCNFISKEKDNALRKGKLVRGDVVLTTRGTIGNSAYYSDQISFDNIRINSGMVIFRVNQEKLLPYYLYLFLNSKDFLSQSESLQSGAAQPQLPIKDIRKLEINIPDLETQKKIASILSNYDDLIQTNQQRIALLEEAAQRLYDEWFVKLRFPNHEQVPVVDGVPEGWGREPIENLFVLQRGFDLPNGQRLDGDVPIYASTGINGFHNEAMVTNPTVITGRSGSLGRVLYSATPCWPLNTTLWVKEFKKASPLYTFFTLKSLGLEGLNGGSAVPTLNRNDVHRIEVISPPLEIIRKFDTQVQSFFDQIENLQNYNQKLAQARDALLPRLMSGKMDVSRLSLKEIA